MSERPPIDSIEHINDLKCTGRTHVNVLQELERDLSVIALIETSIIIDGVEFKRTTPPSPPDRTD